MDLFFWNTQGLVILKNIGLCLVGGGGLFTLIP
jgi:hypothetical protein